MEKLKRLYCDVGFADECKIWQLRLCVESVQVLVDAESSAEYCSVETLLLSSEKVQKLSNDLHIHSDQLTKELLTVPEILKTGNVQAACEKIRSMLHFYLPNIFCPHGLVRQACASIVEPVANDIDRPIQFCAGLANELELVALIENVENLHQLRIQVNNLILYTLLLIVDFVLFKQVQV